MLAAKIIDANKSGDNPYPVYSSQTKDNGLMGYYKDYLYENAITWTTDGANAGTVNYRDEKFYCTNVCGVLLGDKVTPNQMLAEAINNVAKSYVSYVGNPKLMNNVMAEICILLPSEDTERKAISSFVYSLDHLITLHHSKFFGDILKTIASYTLSWEQRKLGEVADIVGGGTPSTLNSDYWDGNIDWYSPAEIIDQIYVYKSHRKITELGLEKSSAKMLPIGTVLFTSRAGIGKTAILAKRGCTNQGFQSIVPYSNTLDSYFIFSRTEELKKYGELVGAGSTFVEVSGRQMENMQLMIPKTIGEQHIIGLLFSTLDHLITLHQSKLEKLQKIKKSMLESMFV